MTLSEQNLRELYKIMSLSEMAVHLGVARSTLYYYFKKWKIDMRTKSEAQSHHIKTKGHQRVGSIHSKLSKNKISDSSIGHWESEEGTKRKSKLADLKRKEWNAFSEQHKTQVVSRLNKAPRPKAGQLSKFGNKLFDFLVEHEETSRGLQLISSHKTDIILHEYGVAIELILPIEIYGTDEQLTFQERYDKLVGELNSAGYRVLIIKDQSTSLSMARCKRAYEDIKAFIASNKKFASIIS